MAKQFGYIEAKHHEFLVHPCGAVTSSPEMLWWTSDDSGGPRESERWCQVDCIYSGRQAQRGRRAATVSVFATDTGDGHQRRGQRYRGSRQPRPEGLRAAVYGLYPCRELLFCDDHPTATEPLWQVQAERRSRGSTGLY